jgi:hypothetical protein
MLTINKLPFVLLRTSGRIFKNTIEYSYFWLEIDYYNFVCHIYAQQGLVGEYATNLMRYFKVLDLGEEARVRHFVRGLKFGIKETVMASGPASFLQAVKKAKENEQAYELGDNRPPLEGLTGKFEDQVVRAVRQKINHLKASVREREVWENRRPANRPTQRALPRE